MSTYKDMIGWDNICTGKYANTIMHHMVRTGTNIGTESCRNRKCNNFMGFAYSYNTEQTRYSFKRSRRKYVQTN